MKEKVAFSVIITLVFVFFHPADAQQPAKMPRVGLIYSSGTAENPSPLFDAFRQGLRDLGYVEGKNILLENRYAEGRLDRMPALLSDLVQEKVDVIVATNNVVISAAQKATKTIPIVMVTTVDPVAAGYVKSFAQPGGNITGIASLSRDISAKRIELLREFLPRVVTRWYSLGRRWSRTGHRV
jgi:putative ABC transport system substrate-binding protein